MDAGAPRRPARGVLSVNRRAAFFIVLGALALGAVLALVWAFWHGGGAGGGRAPAPAPTAPPSQESFDLYFPGGDGLLHAEARQLAVPGEPRARARALVLALLDGPQSEGLLRLFPQAVGLLDVYLTPDGTAYVDLGAEGMDRPPASGSRAEMMRAYSIVDTLVLDLPEVQRVALLWNGVQPGSFSGHLDTSVALPAKRDLLARPGKGAAG